MGSTPRTKTSLEVLIVQTLMIVVIVVTGGEAFSTPTPTSVEALNADGSRLCLLPDLPTRRRYHSMSGSMVCGGYDSNARNSCINFQDGAWKTKPFPLQESRNYFVSWARLHGKSRLLGGDLNHPSALLTSEIVSESGSNAGFPLKYQTS